MTIGLVCLVSVWIKGSYWMYIGAFPLQGGTRTFRNQNLFFWFWFCFHCERPGSRQGSWNLLEPFLGPAPDVELNLSSGNLWAGLAALLLSIGRAEVTTPRRTGRNLSQHNSVIFKILFRQTETQKHYGRDARRQPRHIGQVNVMIQALICVWAGEENIQKELEASVLNERIFKQIPSPSSF